jgi:DNA-binding beta-propeller fold protein YncE
MPFKSLTIATGKSLIWRSAVLAAGFVWATPAIAGSSGYHVLKTVTIGSAKGWDYLTMDSAARRLYIGASDHVEVVDVDAGRVAGKIGDLADVHGVALAPDLGRGLTVNGGTNSSTIVDLKTLKKIGEVKTGKSPDSMVYDPFTKRVFIMNVEDNTATAINAANGTVAGAVALGGRPEFAVADGKGNVFVNITDKSEMLEFDGRKLAALHHWSLAPCDTPSGLAMDQKNRRLFSVCQNKMMVVMNADSGKVVATPAIGEGVDASVFDPDTQLAFASNGEGTLSVIHEDSPDKFTVMDKVPTQFGARTMALDTKTHNILLVTGKRGPGPGGLAARPNTFVVLVVGK